MSNSFAYRRLRIGVWVTLFLCALSIALGVAGWHHPSAIAQPVTRATLTQVLDGSDVFIQNRKAKVNDSATKGQRVRTGATRVQLTFDTGAIGRLGHNSVLTVGQCARLKKGTVLINGAMNGCSGSAVAGVRGTTYIMEVDDAGITRVSVLEGNVAVAPADPSQPVEPEAADDEVIPAKTKQAAPPPPRPLPPPPGHYRPLRLSLLRRCPRLSLPRHPSPSPLPRRRPRGRLCPKLPVYPCPRRLHSSPRRMRAVVSPLWWPLVKPWRLPPPVNWGLWQS